MKTERLIVEYGEDMKMSDVLIYVTHVINAGKISEANNIKHYCWATRFHDGTVAYTRKKKSEKSADSIIIYRLEETK